MTGLLEAGRALLPRARGRRASRQELEARASSARVYVCWDGRGRVVSAR